MQNNSRKKILYVITKSNYGGAQRYVHELATGLPKDAYDVVVAFGGDDLLKTKLEQAGIATRQIESFQRDINLTKELRSFGVLWQLYRNEQPDIVHLNSSKAGGLGAFTARLFGVEHIVFTAHGWPFLEPRNIFWKAALWIASWVTALLSHTVILVSKNDLRHTNMPFVKSKCTIIHTAVPEIRFKSRDEGRAALFTKEQCALHEDDTWLVTNAELTSNKNLFTAIDAVIAYNKSTNAKIYYSIIGDGELKDALKAHIKKYNATEYITLLGYVTDGREYLKAFDMFLLSSKKEGMPYALLEAGAAGLPSIASNVGGIPEIIEHQKNGLFIDPNDKSTLVRALDTLANSPELSQEYGKTLKEKITTQFSLTEMIEKTKRVYKPDTTTR